jgi:hypothetical protein
MRKYPISHTKLQSVTARFLELEIKSVFAAWKLLAD